MLPKPTYTGGVPASRNASSSAGSGRSSGRIHAPVCTTSRSAGSCQGARTGSAASHGWSVIDVVADVVHRWQADRRPVGVERARRTARCSSGCPGRSAPGCRSRPAATAGPAAAAAGGAATAGRSDSRPRTRTGCPASRPPTARWPRPGTGRSPPARRSPRPPRGACRTVRRSARPRAGARPPPTAASPPCTSARTGGPSGTSGTPTSASRSAQSGGAHTRTSAPSCPQPHRQSHQRFDVPARPRTSTTTHAFRDPHFRSFWLRPSDSAARPGSCRKPPGALYVESGKECDLLAIALSPVMAW